MLYLQLNTKNIGYNKGATVKRNNTLALVSYYLWQLTIAISYKKYIYYFKIFSFFFSLKSIFYFSFSFFSILFLCSDLPCFSSSFLFFIFSSLFELNLPVASDLFPTWNLKGWLDSQFSLSCWGSWAYWRGYQEQLDWMKQKQHTIRLAWIPFLTRNGPPKRKREQNFPLILISNYISCSAHSNSRAINLRTKFS